MKVLVTGASGFIGSHLCGALHEAGYAVRAMVRPTSDLSWLAASAPEVAYADLTDPERMRVAVHGTECVLHLGAAVRPRDGSDYERVNVDGTRMLVELSVAAGVRLFVFVSSLSAAGPAGCSGRPLTESEDCRPVSRYGLSKLMAERALLQARDALTAVILRFPVVYGPRDRDVMLGFFKGVRRGLLPCLGGEFSLLYVRDAVQAVQLAIEQRVETGTVYFISDGELHTWMEILSLAERLTGRRVSRLRIPRWAVPSLAALNELLAREGTIFSRDKARELAHEIWTCSPNRARVELGFEPKYPLKYGLEETLRWYEREGWLDPMVRHDAV